MELRVNNLVYTGFQTWIFFFLFLWMGMLEALCYSFSLYVLDDLLKEESSYNDCFCPLLWHATSYHVRALEQNLLCMWPYHTVILSIPFGNGYDSISPSYTNRIFDRWIDGLGPRPLPLIPLMSYSAITDRCTCFYSLSDLLYIVLSDRGLLSCKGFLAAKIH